MRLGFLRKPATSAYVQYPLITFIIPSVGRSTLVQTLQSLQNINNPGWNAIVVFDGIDPPQPVSDPRISYMTIHKQGYANCAGQVRNQGIRAAKTQWVAFVDDDDILLPNYVDQFYNELNTGAEVIIFRMYSTFDDRLVPPMDHLDFYPAHVGISFCLKTSICREEHMWFNPCRFEDFDLLNRLRSLRKRIRMSPAVTYAVRPKHDALYYLNKYGN
jgi:glycosyltransferase involved in cell wall biosynthesis